MEAEGEEASEALKQYEIWWAVLPEPIGRRPVLLLSRDQACDYLKNILIAEITTSIRAIPQELRLGSKEGLPERCVANFDNLHSVQKSFLQRRIGALPSSRIDEVKSALGHALSWPELTIAD